MASRSTTIAASRACATAVAMTGACFGAAHAQVSTSFDLVGPIQAFALDTPGDAFSGARITVNGLDVVIPGKLRIQFPARFLRPFEVFKQGPDPTMAASGLALADPAKPIAAFEASIAGNFVGNQARAGLVSISQHQLFSLTGRVQEVRGARGELLVGTPGGQSARVRLNDPEGKFGVPTGAGANPPAIRIRDERFRVDTENPSVRSATGFPMCVPRPTDGPATACKAGNRPADTAQRNFWMGQAPPGDPKTWIVPCTGCDPTKSVAFRPGDDVTVAGILAEDAEGRFVAASSVVAALGIYTLPGREEARVVLDESLIGTGATAANVAAEGQDRLRVEGWTTDPTRTVSVYAVEVRSDGKKVTRLISGGQPPASDPFGRVRVRLDKAPAVLRNASGSLSGAPRELMLAIDGQNGRTIPDGTVLDAPPGTTSGPPGSLGRYIGPVAEFIFSEPTRPGDPPLPHGFSCLSFLFKDATAFEDGMTAATPALEPWPEVTGPPANPVCGR